MIDRKLIAVIGFAAVGCLVACKQHKQEEKRAVSASPQTEQVFQLPEVPAMLTTPELRINFLAKHYWDRIELNDSNWVWNENEMEQAWANYCDLLERTALADAQEAMTHVMTHLSQNKEIFNHFTELADKYLYDPNSPMRNEELYIPVLEVMVRATTLTEEEKIRPQARLNLAQQNRPHTQAFDFTYTLPTGRQARLYEIPTAYTLLFINNPGCEACTAMIADLKQAEIMTRLLNQKRLTILSFYPDGDLDTWKNHINDFPKEWIIGYDQEQRMNTEQLYDLKAIPTLYLLDKDKKVILKDAHLHTICNYLSALKP